MEKKKSSCEVEVWSRVCGFFRPIQSWNKGKRAEHGDKKTFEKASKTASDDLDNRNK